MKIIVAGTGIAGLTAALHARERGHDVTIVTKSAFGEGCTRYAQGGIAGVRGPGDSTAQHAADTIAAGAGLADVAAVEALVNGADAALADLVARGVAFDRDASGQLRRGREAAHRHARIAHAGGDATGAEISRALTDAVRRAGIGVAEQAMLVDLHVEAGAVRGVRLLRDGRFDDLEADAVVLATGGAGRLYSRTTNPEGTTGDGIAVALRAGARVSDLEFVQFHPTVLAGTDPFVLSEAVRGEGATLLDDAGRRFCLDVHPDGELAPRDVVAQAIARQCARQGAPVLLDATMLGASTLARRFPTIDRVTRERGFDWSREPLPVTPAAHYLMGGIDTDLDGRTSLPGLFAAGEVARTGVHGANRLASNSLLEGAVFGARVARAVTEPWPPGASPANELTKSAAPDHLPLRNAAAPPAFSRATLQELMSAHVGLLRSDAGLAHARQTLHAWAASPARLATLADHENANLLLVAQATASAAAARTDSVGAHVREPALIGV